jgi:thioesterase domain-containing protein/acyl carrier protein
VAYVVASEGKEAPPPAELRGHLKEHLPDYMIPAAYVSLEALPLTPSGKLDRKALPAPAGGMVVDLGAAIEGTENLAQAHMTDLWTRLLEQAPIGLDDNFFDLGGHSLLAVELLAQIEIFFGVALPLPSLFEAPTIRSLVELLPGEKGKIAYPSLVPFQTQGSKPPLIVSHGGGGGCFNLVTLAPHLDPDQPLYGLQARGIDGCSDPLETVEEMAQAYMEEIVAAIPEGPVCLAGYSMGGSIAFEIARRMELEKRKVSALILMDTFGPLPAWTLAHHSERVLTAFHNRWKEFTPGDWIQEVGVLGRRGLQWMGSKLLPASSAPAVEGRENVRVTLEAMDDILFQAAWTYDPKPYAGSMDYLLATDQALPGESSRFLWEQLAEGGVRHHEVPVHHMDMLNPRGVVPVAKILQKVMNRSADQERLK